jgi:hypothetical protein
MLASLLKKLRAGKSRCCRPIQQRSFVPALENLETRLAPAVIAYSARSEELSVRGNNGDDTFVIRHHGDGRVTVEDIASGFNQTYSEVSKLNVNTGDFGFDVVRYTLDGNLTRSMDIHVQLSTDDSRFTGTLNRDITGHGLHLNFDIKGSNDNDTISLYGSPTAPNIAGDHLTDGLAINENGLYIASDSTLSFKANGSTGDDRIYFRYSGEMDGALSFDLNGSWDRDRIDVGVTLARFSLGDVVNSVVQGGSGDDYLRVRIVDSSQEHNSIDAYAHGGNLSDWFNWDHDVGDFTPNVDYVEIDELQ